MYKRARNIQGYSSPSFLHEEISMDIFEPMDALKKIEIYVLKVSTDYLSIIYKETNGE